MTEESPPAARFAPNGDRFSAAVMFDFNSMYLWSEEQSMPLTAGIRWLKNGAKYRKRYLGSRGSFKAVQWIYYKQAQFDKQGRNIQIEHQYFRGEKIIDIEEKSFHVDGYAVVDGVETIMEFNGSLSCYQQVLIPYQINI